MSDGMSGMAEVLAVHQRDHEKRTLHQHCTCGWFGKALQSDFTAHQAEALTAAGFGPVKEEKRLMELAALMAYDAVEEGALREAAAKALEDAADVLARSTVRDPLGKATFENYADWLRARAAAVRGEG